MTATLTKSDRPDFLATAIDAWGPDLPAHVEALALECNRVGATETAKRLGYSPGVISPYLRGKYKGNLDLVKAKIEGALMGALVDCPVLGEMARDACLNHQQKPFAATNSTRVELYRACRGGCPHSRIGGDA